MVRRPFLLTCGVALSALVGIGCGATDGATSSNGGASASGAPASGGEGALGGSPSNTGTGGASSGAGGSGNPNGAGGASGGTTNGGAGNGGSATGGMSGVSGSSNGGASGGVAGQANGGAGAGAGAGAGGSAGSSGGTPGVRIVGRTAPGDNGAVRFSWPGVSINARFTGTQVAMNLNDGSNKNRFTVVIDGGTPKTLTTTPGQTELTLGTGLSSGTHDLVVWRNTEASIGVSVFSGLTNFGTGGALLAPAAAPDRRIEVIGDSLSVGAGVEGTSTTCTPSIDAFTNNYLAYGSVAARSVQADVVTIAWSGIGVYRSYGGSAPTMPQRYDYAIPNDDTAWDFSKYQPQVVVINLGTNDFSAGNPGQPYIDAYVSFIQHVRSKYASANMILIDMYGGDRLTAINSVITALKGDGETKVAVLSFSAVPNNNTACNSHPNIAAQAAMGGLLATRLKSLMNW
jgi:lysophospholipase L1-like esterase